MEDFTFVIFGITSNLSQLKILPALYDLEVKNLIHPDTKIIGIGRKDIEINKYINEVLSISNRHHQHPYDTDVIASLVSRVEYYREDINHKDDLLYKKLAGSVGNTLYYLATYPELYKNIFTNLKKYGLNIKHKGWSKIVIEKPIGTDLESSKHLNKLLSEYFEEDNIFRVDHYLGKADLENVFYTKFNPLNIDSVQLSVLEDFGIGKRGAYYNATGALVDMGQNHFMQMLSAVTKEELTINGREKVISSLSPDSSKIVFGQYEGYENEESIPVNSTTDTFFALKTQLIKGLWRGIPIYMRSGKMLAKSEVKISLIGKDGSVKSFVIISTGQDAKLDPYEKLILEAVRGNRFYFNSAKEVEESWKFIDALKPKDIKIYKYDPGSYGPAEADNLIEKDGRSWV